MVQKQLLGFTNEIENISQLLQSLDNIQLKNSIIKFRKMQDAYNLNELLIPCFALVQELANRTLGLRHYPSQMLAGIALHEGKIVEMNTGEGKTLVSTLPITLNALKKRGVHVVTTNEYLAERDYNWMRPIFYGMDLSVGLIKNKYTINQKKSNYKKNITYITSSELVFDYLKDNTASRNARIIQPDFNFCLIDEVDSILIDEARTPLIISEDNRTSLRNKIYTSSFIVDLLENSYHFTIDKKRKDIFLTEQGYQEIETLLGLYNIYDRSNPWTLEILNALKAKHLYKRNKDYVVLNNKIAIIDEFSGRIMKDRRWSFGLHEAIEAKEKLPIGNITANKASITYQNFFPLYPKLAGMTGTAFSSKEEFKTIYKLDVVCIESHKPSKRLDLRDKVFISEVSKWKQIVNRIVERHHIGQPILIGTSSIEKSEYLSDLLYSVDVSHKLLNAKPENAKKENEIIAQAGQVYAVTIATNMAGRGTDIVLGGNLSFLIKKLIKEQLFVFLKAGEKIMTYEHLHNESTNFCFKIVKAYKYNINKLKKDIENLPVSLISCESPLIDFYQSLYTKNYWNWLLDYVRVIKLGGLFVLGTERAESRRIDDQLRGRSGRQGDPGQSEFYLSLDDPISKLYSGSRNLKKNLIDNYNIDQNLEISSALVEKTIENSQKKVEELYFKIRENTFNYESIINFQRQDFYKCRKFFFKIQNYEKCFMSFVNDFWSFEESKYYYRSTILISRTKNLTPLFIKWAFLDFKLKKYYFYKQEALKDIFSFLFLSILDNLWINHIANISYIKETINWNAYGQQNPLDEYFLQSEQSYNLILLEICYFIIDSLLYKAIPRYSLFSE